MKRKIYKKDSLYSRNFNYYLQKSKSFKFYQNFKKMFPQTEKYAIINLYHTERIEFDEIRCPSMSAG